MIIPFHKIVCVRCGKICFSHMRSWWCDECKELEFRQLYREAKKGGVE